MISSELPELIGVGGRIYVMPNWGGRRVARLEEMTQEKVVEHMCAVTLHASCSSQKEYA